ncbi:OLC1v1036306C1 [Oldenlandia corymbosa var. corymbosa]|uniref:OLC1v1036306C1 n=1 Tax=Oldenlandia corymbosa var. corymbosa TaxID=529605 RepID=A0AAV1CV09_OLDCO|nr:OLC1v1036306C1 [Oldenlandia corymbosa var. corymbosa]
MWRLSLLNQAIAKGVDLQQPTSHDPKPPAETLAARDTLSQPAKTLAARIKGSTSGLSAAEKETIMIDLQPSPERNENEIDVVNVHNSIPTPTTNRFSALQDMCDGEVDLLVETDDEVENVYTEGNDVQGDKPAALMNEPAPVAITIMDEKSAAPSNELITDDVLASMSQLVVGKFPDDSFKMESQDDNVDQEDEGRWSEGEKDVVLITQNEQGERSVKKKRSRQMKEARAKLLEGAELRRCLRLQ